jgi:hypothetical protein
MSMGIGAKSGAQRLHTAPSHRKEPTMRHMLTKTVALSLTVLGMTATLALAQPSNPSSNDANSQDPVWHQSWHWHCQLNASNCTSVQ